MMGWASLAAGVVKLLSTLAGFFIHERAKADGAAIQRDVDLRAENERLNRADIAADGSNAGGLLSAEKSKYNRDNQPS